MHDFAEAGLGNWCTSLIHCWELAEHLYRLEALFGEAAEGSRWWPGMDYRDEMGLAWRTNRDWLSCGWHHICIAAQDLPESH